MQNISNNRVSYVLSDEKKQRISDLFNQLEAELEFTVGLNNTERQRLPKINKGNKLFVQDSVMATDNGDSVLPAYVKTEEVAKDLNLYEDLDPFLLKSESIFYKLRDTQMLAGSEAYTTALVIYKMYKTAADAGIPGAQAVYNSLRERFMHQSNTDDAETTEETTE